MRNSAISWPVWHRTVGVCHHSSVQKDENEQGMVRKERFEAANHWKFIPSPKYVGMREKKFSKKRLIKTTRFFIWCNQKSHYYRDWDLGDSPITALPL